jgi:phosphoribosyl 1,2-cyclic phosphodiesterase
LKADPAVLRFAVLGSGSSANGYIFEYGSFSFLVDNGYSLTEFRRRMKLVDFNEKNLAFIFLTHLHSDHFKGVETLSRTLNIPVVTHESMPVEDNLKQPGIHRLDIQSGKPYQFDNLHFQAFDTSHDAPHSLGFHFTLGDSSFTLITDTGCISEEMENLALKSDYLFLESNYSPDMLHRGPYPNFLKKRILSDLGHLSNLDAAAFMSRLADREQSSLKKIFLCHLSQKNNTVEKVREEVERIYSGRIPYTICPRNDSLSYQSLVQSV